MRYPRIVVHNDFSVRCRERQRQVGPGEHWAARKEDTGSGRTRTKDEEDPLSWGSATWRLGSVAPWGGMTPWGGGAAIDTVLTRNPLPHATPPLVALGLGWPSLLIIPSGVPDSGIPSTLTPVPFIDFRPVPFRRGQFVGSVCLAAFVFSFSFFTQRNPSLGLLLCSCVTT